MIKKGLGKGLGALLTTNEVEGLNESITEVKINEIEPNQKQPRKNFDGERLQQLAESIKQYGIVQPIIVRRENGTYHIIAGERRWRAARIAGLDTVPVIVKEATSQQVMEIALIENLQREDLNPIEEAQAYDRLIKEFNLTQEDISITIGKSRPAISNSLRLLSLNDNIKSYLISGELTSGHARALLSLEDDKLKEKAAKEIIEKNLSVRETEKLIKSYTSIKKKGRVKSYSIEYKEIEEKLKEIFGTKVKLISKRNKGKIMIEYYSNEELERILEMVESIARK